MTGRALFPFAFDRVPGWFDLQLDGATWSVLYFHPDPHRPAGFGCSPSLSLAVELALLTSHPLDLEV